MITIVPRDLKRIRALPTASRFLPGSGLTKLSSNRDERIRNLLERVEAVSQKTERARRLDRTRRNCPDRGVPKVKRHSLVLRYAPEIILTPLGLLSLLFLPTTEISDLPDLEQIVVIVLAPLLLCIFVLIVGAIWRALREPW